jgi:anti-anti-sigma factor
VDLLATRLYRDGLKRTLFVTGELDVATAPALEGAVDGALDGQNGELCLDFSGLEFMDSTGALALIHAHNKAGSLGTRLVILSPAPVVRRVLELMDLDRIMDIKDGAPSPRRSA